MKFIAIINRDVKLGYALNGLGHITLGVGHRLQGTPDVGIYFGNTAQVREFRQLAATIAQEKMGRTVFSDFPQTMHGGDTPKQLELGRSTAEADMQYFASYFLGEELDSRMIKLLGSFSKLKNYQAYFSSVKAELLPPKTSPVDNEVTGKKIIMLINSKHPMTQTLNAAILSALSVGGRADHSELRLLDVLDKDGNAHRNISFHPFPILKPTNPAKHTEMAGKAQSSTSLVSDTQSTEDDQPLVTVVFGNESEVTEVAPKTLARLFDNVIKDSELVAASGTELNASGSKLEKVHPAIGPDEKHIDQPKPPQSGVSLKFSLGDKAALAADTEKKIAEIIDQVLTVAGTIDASALQAELPKHIIAIKTLVRNEAKSEEHIKALISEVLSEASGKGKLESVQYLVATYSEHLTPDDFYHSAQYAQINLHNSVYEFLNDKKPAVALTVK